jgi:hypothetical protein
VAAKLTILILIALALAEFISIPFMLHWYVGKMDAESWRRTRACEKMFNDAMIEWKKQNESVQDI